MPKILLTEKFIAHQLTCPPGKRRIEYCDTRVPGLFIEVRATSEGQGTLYLRFRDGSKLTRYAKLGRTMDISLADARKKAAVLRGRILAGDYPGADKRDKQRRMTFAKFFQQRYLPFAKPRKRSWRDDEKLYNRRLRTQFGNLPLDEITLEAVERFLGDLAEEGLAASSVRHHGQLLKRCTSLAVKWKLLDSDPLSGLKLQQVHDAREYFLSDEELQRLLTVLDNDSARVPCLAAKLLLFTGCRVGELLRCRYRDLELESATPTLKVISEHSKNGRSRYVPLSAEALKVIDQLPSKNQSEYLFTNSRTGARLQSIDFSWRKLRVKAGVPTLRLHDLRHNFASMLVSSGESLYTVQKILGHQSSDQSLRYSHLSNTALQDAANSVTGYLDKALNKKGDTGQ